MTTTHQTRTEFLHVSIHGSGEEPVAWRGDGGPRSRPWRRVIYPRTCCRRSLASTALSPQSGGHRAVGQLALRAQLGHAHDPDAAGSEARDFHSPLDRTVHHRPAHILRPSQHDPCLVEEGRLQPVSHRQISDGALSAGQSGRRAEPRQSVREPCDRSRGPDRPELLAEHCHRDARPQRTGRPGADPRRCRPT